MLNRNKTRMIFSFICLSTVSLGNAAEQNTLSYPPSQPESGLSYYDSQIDALILQEIMQLSLHEISSQQMSQQEFDDLQLEAGLRASLEQQNSLSQSGENHHETASPSPQKLRRSPVQSHEPHTRDDRINMAIQIFIKGEHISPHAATMGDEELAKALSAQEFYDAQFQSPHTLQATVEAANPEENKDITLNSAFYKQCGKYFQLIREGVEDEEYPQVLQDIQAYEYAADDFIGTHKEGQYRANLKALRDQRDQMIKNAEIAFEKIPKVQFLMDNFPGITKEQAEKVLEDLGI